jgi:MYXO-CTERM domain-containing protein
MPRPRVVPRLLALAAFFALATGSTPALADLIAPEPAPEDKPPLQPMAEPEPEPEPDFEVKPEKAKPEEVKPDAAANKSGNCSLVDNDDRVIGLAGLVLLISGFALRRRRS